MGAKFNDPDPRWRPICAHCRQRPRAIRGPYCVLCIEVWARPMRSRAAKKSARTRRRMAEQFAALKAAAPTV